MSDEYTNKLIPDILEKIGGLRASVSGLQEQQDRDRRESQARFDNLEARIVAGFKQSQTDREAQGTTIGELIQQSRNDVKTAMGTLAKNVTDLTMKEHDRARTASFVSKFATGAFAVFLAVLGGLAANMAGWWGGHKPL